MEVYWLEQTEADVPAGTEWLGAGEAERLAGLRFPKRRADWRLGRWTAKHAVAAYLREPADPRALSRIEIRAAPSGAPEAFLDNNPAPVAISLSHRDGIALCTVGSAGVTLGCDLEVVEPRCEAFTEDYFNSEELAALREVRPAPARYQLITLLWSGKESLLKALGEGLRLDTRSVTVSINDTEDAFRDWRPLQARENSSRVYAGWWRQTAHLVRTIVGTPPLGRPVCLGPTSSGS